MCLATAGFIFAVYGFLSYWIFSKLGSDEFPKDSAILIFAIYWPKCILGLVFGAWFMVLAIRDWHGNVHRMLLLKLLKDQQKKMDSP